jgi:hypothetical protein
MTDIEAQLLLPAAAALLSSGQRIRLVRLQNNHVWRYEVQPSRVPHCI